MRGYVIIKKKKKKKKVLTMHVFLFFFYPLPLDYIVPIFISIGLSTIYFVCFHQLSGEHCIPRRKKKKPYQIP